MKKINKKFAMRLRIFITTLAIVTPMLGILSVQISEAAACGGGSYKSIQTDFDFGCKGSGDPILDLTFAGIRFLSTGAGLILTASMVWAGISYASSKDDPQATARAVKRIKANIIALMIFIFAYGILNYIIPGKVLG